MVEVVARATSAYVSVRQRTSAYVSMRQHTSTWARIYVGWFRLSGVTRGCAADSLVLEAVVY
jgi:hypothetical protein